MTLVGSVFSVTRVDHQERSPKNQNPNVTTVPMVTKGIPPPLFACTIVVIILLIPFVCHCHAIKLIQTLRRMKTAQYTEGRSKGPPEGFFFHPLLQAIIDFWQCGRTDTYLIPSSKATSVGIAHQVHQDSGAFYKTMQPSSMCCCCQPINCSPADFNFCAPTGS